jgi:hypothetical protein
MVVFVYIDHRKVLKFYYRRENSVTQIWIIMITNSIYMSHFTLVVSNNDIDYGNHTLHHMNVLVFPRILNCLKCLLILLD